MERERIGLVVAAIGIMAMVIAPLIGAHAPAAIAVQIAIPTMLGGGFLALVGVIWGAS